MGRSPGAVSRNNGIRETAVRRPKMKLVNFHKAGEGYKKNSKGLGIPVPNVKTIIQKRKKHGHTKTLLSGRSRKILERAARQLTRELRKNPKQTARGLKKFLEASGIKVHISTFKCSLHKSGMFGRKVRRKPLLTSRHKAARLEYAKEHVNKQMSFGIRLCGLKRPKLNYLVIICTRTCGKKKTLPMRRRTAFPQSNTEAYWCFGGVCLHQALQLCIKWKEKWMQANINRF